MRKKRASLEWAKICYGVDLQMDGPTVVRSEKTRNGVNHTKVSPDDPAFLSDMRSGVPCVGHIQTKCSFVRWLEAPFSSTAKTRKVLPTLLDIELPFPLNDCTYTFLDESVDDEGKRNVLSVASRKSDVSSRLDNYRKHELDPMAMDQEGLALWSHGLTEVPTEGTRARVHIHLEKENATLVAGNGDRLLGIHALAMSDPAGHVFRLVRARFEPGTEIQVIWSGREATSQATVDPIREKISLWPGTSSIVKDPDLFLARAVSSRALTGNAAPCNLRSGTLVHEGVTARQYRISLVAAVATLLAGVVLSCANLLWRHSAAGHEAAIDETFGGLADDLAGYHLVAKGKQACDMAEQSVQERMEQLKPFTSAFDPVLSKRIASIMQCAKSRDLRFSEISITPDKAKILGDCPTWNSANVLVVVLEGENPGHVRLDRSDANNEGRIPFSITAGGQK